MRCSRRRAGPVGSSVAGCHECVPALYQLVADQDPVHRDPRRHRYDAVAVEFVADTLGAPSAMCAAQVANCGFDIGGDAGGAVTRSPGLIVQTVRTVALVPFEPLDYCLPRHSVPGGDLTRRLSGTDLHHGAIPLLPQYLRRNGLRPMPARTDEVDALGFRGRPWRGERLTGGHRRPFGKSVRRARGPVAHRDRDCRNIDTGSASEANPPAGRSAAPSLRGNTIGKGPHVPHGGAGAFSQPMPPAAPTQTVGRKYVLSLQVRHSFTAFDTRPCQMCASVSHGITTKERGR